MGELIGCVVAMLVLSRIAMGLLKKPVGDNKRRVLMAHAAAYLAAVGLGGLSFAGEVSNSFAYAAIAYGLPVPLWLVVDLLALKGRLAKAQIPHVA